MIEKKIQGFVYQKTTYGEYDAILNVLTEDGPMAFKARGILKSTSKNAPACNHFVISDYLLTAKSEKGHYLLKSARIVKMYHQPFENLLTSASYLFLCHLIPQIIESVNPYAFLLVCFILFEKKEYPLSVLNYFLKNLLNQLGYTPFVSGCVLCHSKNNLLSFSLEEGGFICSQCFDASRHHLLNKELLKEIYQFYKSDQYYRMEEVYAISLFKLYAEFIKSDVGITLNGLDFIYQCL